MRHITNTRVITGMILAIFFGLGMNIFLRDTAAAQTAPFLISPYYGTTTITQGWKPPSNPSHEGYDFLLVYESLIAADGGIVGFVGWQNNACHHYNGTDQNLGMQCGFGLYTRIDHNNNHSTYYAHMSSVAFSLTNTGVSPVASGQIIGTSGATGWTIGSQPNTPGPHLHFEVRNASNTKINPFAPNLWKDGQWASTSRPIPAPVSISADPLNAGNEPPYIINVDDNLSNLDGFSKGWGGFPNNTCQNNCGNWSQAASLGYYLLDMYHTLADRGTNPLDQWARWQPSGLPSYGFGGIYEIYVRAPSPNATTWQAPYVIKHQAGTSQAVVDQLGLTNQWVSIGTYRMAAGDYVYTHDATGEVWNQHCTGWCQLGVDAIKFVRRGIIFAPDIAYGNGWSHTVTLRSNGGEAKTIVNFLKEDGSVLCSTLPTLPAHSTQTFTCNSTAVASLVVDGSQDLSVVVENINSFADGRYLATAYPGATQPALVHYAPLVLKRWPTLKSGWRQTTDLFLYNPSPQSASVTVTFYESWGSNNRSHSVTLAIAANGRATVSGTQMPTWESGLGGSLASARVESTQPLVVTTRNLVGVANGAGNIDTPYLAGSYLAESRPTNFLYATTAARSYFGYDSSLQVQNASASSATFRIRYYPLNTATPTLTLTTTLGSYRSANFWRPSGMSDGFFGSATVEALYGGGPLAVMAQYDRFDLAGNRYGVTQYEGVSSLNAATAMAHIQKEALYTPLWTYTGIQAQNRNASSVNIQLHYFQSGGSSAGSSATKPNVPTNAAVNFWSTSGTPPEIPVFNGSGISGVGNVALLVNFDRLGDTGWQYKDGMMGYAAVK